MVVPLAHTHIGDTSATIFALGRSANQAQRRHACMASSRGESRNAKAVTNCPACVNIEPGDCTEHALLASVLRSSSMHAKVQVSRASSLEQSGATGRGEPKVEALIARRAWRSFDGSFDGDSDDSGDERAADMKRQRIRPSHSTKLSTTRAVDVVLQPATSGGRSLTVVATADLHRHHDDKYIAEGSMTLSEWFESELSPAHVDVVLMAGDLGLEINEELSSRSWESDAPATVAASLTPRQKDVNSLSSFNRLLHRICNAKPTARVVVCAGNHDGLLCADDECLACHSEHLQRCEAGTDAHKGWLTCPSDAARCARDRLLEGLSPDRARVLTDEAWDFLSSHGVPVRVVGSPWTSYDTRGVEHISRSHFWRPQSGFIYGGRTLLPALCGGGQGIQTDLNCDEFWREHWERIGAMLEAGNGAESCNGCSILVTHAPPHGALDIVRGTSGQSQAMRVGDRVLMETLESLHCPPRLHAFGHVHAMQSRDEPPGGPRLCASKRVAGCLFANVAAERQLPAITSHRLRRAAGERLSMPALTAADWAEGPATLLMRPPTVIELPVDGWHVADDQGWQMAWQPSRREQVACE